MMCHSPDMKVLFTTTAFDNLHLLLYERSRCISTLKLFLHISLSTFVSYLLLERKASLDHSEKYFIWALKISPQNNNKYISLFLK